MPRWLDRLRGTPQTTEIQRYTLDQYAQWRIDAFDNPLGVQLLYGNYGLKHEEVDAGYAAYARQIYATNPVVFSVIQARMSLFTEARFQWQRLGGGRPGDLFGSQELAILETPWPNGTTGDLLACIEQDVSLCGNSYIVRDGDRLWWRRPDWVSIILDAPPDVAVYSNVIGYMYTVGGVNSGGETELYPVSDVAHFRPTPDPCAAYRGMSWLQPLVREVQSDNAATTHKLAWWQQAATPNLAVSPKVDMTPEQFAEFMNITEGRHAGASNAGRTMYLGFGADVKVIGADMQQMAFTQIQGHSETRICAAGRVPPIVVGVSEGLQAATYSNYSQARRAFADSWARPQWRGVAGALGTIVDKPPAGGPARLWYDDRDIAFLRDDAKDAAQVQQIKAATIASYVTAGYTPESAVAAVDADDRSLLVHTGLYSVQLQPPGTQQQAPPDQTPPQDRGGAADGQQP